MKLLELTVEGFRSFGKEQVLDFSALSPGLYHITGTNRVEPSLEANGIGKSSLFEALFWVLYGKTSRNLRAGTIKNWDYKGQCRVQLAFEQHGNVYLLSRSWNPNKLNLQKESEKLEEILQEKLEELIGLAPEAFLCAIYFAQLVPSFVDLSPSDRMSLYSSVLKLDEWEARSDKSSEHTHKLDQDRTQLLQEIAVETGLLTELKDRTWKEQEQLWDKHHEHAIKEIRACLTQENARLLRLEKDLITLKPLDYNAVTTKLSEVSAEFSLVARELDRITRMKIGKCSACHQEVTGPHLERERGLLAREHHTLQLQIKTLEKSAAEESKTKDRILSINAEVATCRSSVALYTKQLANARNEINPFTQQRKVSESKISEKKRLLIKKQIELEECESLQKAVSFWVKGFKDLRLLLIEESLQQLNIEVNECLYQLGLQDWEIRFETEQETKAKTVRRGFNCLITAPGEHTAPWEAWSGGESQRLRVAISMGISNLITSRVGLLPNIELHDEPSTWLSESGINALLQTLDERAKLQQKIILLADHRALDFGGFTDIIRIEKDRDGSRFAQDKNLEKHR